jgi:predicted nuclease with TOPRIM domain
LDEQDTTAEELAFDKAEEAASAELLEKSRETLAAEINSLKERIKETHAEQRAPLEAEMERLEARMARLSKMLDERKED